MNKLYRVTYSSAAADDLAAIYSYIAFTLKNPIAAKRQTNRIRQAIRDLNQNPFRHSEVEWEPWSSMGMRKFPVDNFIVFYLPDSDAQTVKIDRILYGGMDLSKIDLFGSSL